MGNNKGTAYGEIIDRDLKNRIMHYLQNSDKGELKNRQIYIWGSLQGARQTAMVLDEFNFDFVGFIDNDIKAKRKRIKGYYDKRVLHSEEVLSKLNPDALFILPTRKYTETIIKQILRHGFSMDNVYSPFGRHTAMYISNKCNLNCRFCPIHGENRHVKREYEDVSFELAKRIIDEMSKSAASIGVSAMGEPLIHKEFASILSYAYQKFYSIIVFSNGFALDADMANKVFEIAIEDAKALTFSFSVTGFSEKIYNRFQGSGQTDNTIRNKVYENINCFIDQRNANRIPKERLQIVTSYILSQDEDNYQDLIEYMNYWEGKLDGINITPERCYFVPDIESLGYQYKIDEESDFLCRFIYCKIAYCDGSIGVCTETDLNNESYIGNVLDQKSPRTMREKHSRMQENFLKGDWPDFCCTCYRRNTYTDGFAAQELKRLIDNISLIKAFLEGKSRVFLYGLSSYQRALYILVQGEDIIDREKIGIIDPETEGYFHNKRILKPTLENLKGQDLIVFEESSFFKLDIDIINSLHSWISYRDFI